MFKRLESEKISIFKNNKEVLELNILLKGRNLENLRQNYGYASRRLLNSKVYDFVHYYRSIPKCFYSPSPIYTASNVNTTHSSSQSLAVAVWSLAVEIQSLIPAIHFSKEDMVYINKIQLELHFLNGLLEIYSPLRGIIVTSSIPSFVQESVNSNTVARSTYLLCSTR
ncbi:hypothetical protein BD560DRAFT_494530 [Blakeslea trispora]|nr:hypothetical protein BD560DRAFT_494530 [Blakeslea trispora]